ncbi:tetratricopeptide repeat protein [Saccharothrix sp. S26]|uniref:AfsR/SARP family transcriptional regulator n=1 Tax=Saccharothrix sp. S26 TaxID=2907215 RepID=UPI001F2DBFD0|nr:BTAD domain-containing putative transcriptional regulator [Saccharothrix sp. S26]MCE7000694.1 tetratricopeptide repeat protein [Saccharothrix sp. S26]
MPEVLLLGEVAVAHAGVEVGLGPDRQRCVLVALAVDAGRVVSVERLTERVWGTTPPSRARGTLLSYLSRLRHAVAGVEDVDVVRAPGGYALEVDPAAVDLHRFRDLRARARAGDDHRAAVLLEQALDLWRGEALTGLGGEWAATERARLDQERRDAESDLVDVRLRSGHGADLVPRLAVRAAESPLDERVAAQYVLALHRAGRTADALAHHRQVRARLVEELGTDPGPALEHLHQRILTGDPTLTAACTAPGPTSTPAPATTGPTPTSALAPAGLVTAGPTAHGSTATAVAPTTAGSATAARPDPIPDQAAGPVPRQLPAVPASFVGRRAELAGLDAALADSPTVVITAIAGAGGIGKTALALHWAHRHADRFPDGQLFADLRGFSPDGEPMPPAVAVRGFLDALGVEPARIPTDPHAQTGLFRSLVAGRRMLLVLDNAADTAQVTPLLPGSPTCAVVVTSRHQLPGLITGHAAHHVRLDVLPDAEARALLGERLGARVAAEPGAVAELIASCGGFPLALSIVAGHARTRPHVPLAALAAELRDFGLGALDDDEPAASLPAVLSWSRDALTPAQATSFALLGVAPGVDIGLPAAAGLIGLSVTEARAVLRGLEQASLVTQEPHGRYRMHDLIRAYAADTARDLPDDVRDAALRRVLDCYTRTAHQAARLLNPQRLPLALDPPEPGARPHPLPDVPAALAWLDAEHANLLAAQRAATAHQRHHTVWQVAWALITFQARRAHLRDRLAVWRAALDAAAHLPDPAARIRAHRFLGIACVDLGRHDDAAEHLHHALALAEHHRDPTEQALTHQTLVRACERRGDDRLALLHATRALGLFRGLDQPVWVASALNDVGWCAARLGEYDTARAHCQDSLALQRRHDNPRGVADTLDSLGYIEHRTGEHREAVRYYRQALALYRELGNTNTTATTLEKLGQAHAALGEHDAARAVWREALDLFRAQHRAEDAERVERQLADLRRGVHEPGTTIRG